MSLFAKGWVNLFSLDSARVGNINNRTLLKVSITNQVRDRTPMTPDPIDPI